MIGSLALGGCGLVHWRDGEAPAVSCLNEIAVLGRYAVVSLTEFIDLPSQELFFDLAEFASMHYRIEFIVATRQWIDLTRDDPVDFKQLRAVASLPNVSLALVSDHGTGFVPVRDTAHCWDYRCGTPSHVPSIKVGDTTYRLSSYQLIGVRDWIDRAKIARNIPPNGEWFSFV